MFLLPIILFTSFSFCTSSAEVDSKIQGRWFMVYTKAQEKMKNHLDLIRDSDAVCKNSEYIPVSDCCLEFHFTFREGTYDGTLRAYRGHLCATHEDDLLTMLSSNHKTRKSYPYKILKAGPVVDGLYQYLIYVCPTLDDVRVNVRNVKEFKQLYNEAVLQWLEEQGYSVIEIDQSEKCQYAWPGSKSQSS